MSTVPPGVLAAFRHIDSAVRAVAQLKEMGYRDMTVYSPVPNHELMDAVGHKVSPVRLWTLLGGLTGVTTGYWLTLWMSRDWALVVGGKPIGSWIPYTVIAFELTILFGAGATILGVLFHSWKSRKPAAYDGRFSNDQIGIFVPCGPERRNQVQQLLQNSGAEEVRLEA